MHMKKKQKADRQNLERVETNARWKKYTNFKGADNIQLEDEQEKLKYLKMINKKDTRRK